mgnify:CR=1 FL=1
MRHASAQETLDFFDPLMPEIFGEVPVNTAKSWRISKSMKPMVEPAGAAEAKHEEKKRRGPKMRATPIGQVPQGYKPRFATFTILVTLAAVIMSHVRVGIPINSSIVLGLALGVFAANCVTVDIDGESRPWVPSISWIRYFVVGQLGLSFRQGTKAARSLPSNYLHLREMFLMRCIWINNKFKIPKCFWINCD